MEKLKASLLQRTLFAIKVKSAADLRGYSAYKEEEELLVFPGTVFEVLNVKRMSGSASSVDF